MESSAESGETCLSSSSPSPTEIRSDDDDDDDALLQEDKDFLLQQGRGDTVSWRQLSVLTEALESLVKVGLFIVLSDDDLSFAGEPKLQGGDGRVEALMELIGVGEEEEEGVENIAAPDGDLMK